MGLVHIYCGDGKGKTSAAIGLAVRAAGCGRRVVIARFLKTDNSGEVEILKKLPEVTLIPCRKTFGFVRSMDEETKKECADYNRNLFFEAVKLAEDADLVVFDPDTVIDKNSYDDPRVHPAGIAHVLVNGVFVVEDAALTGARPGRVIRD